MSGSADFMYVASSPYSVGPRVLYNGSSYSIKEHADKLQIINNGKIRRVMDSAYVITEAEQVSANWLKRFDANKVIHDEQKRLERNAKVLFAI